MEGFKVTAKCSITNGLPSVIIVELGGKVVDEAKERIRSAFASSQLEFPKKRVTINLAPADIPKEESSLDLAIATAILTTNNSKMRLPLESDAFIGELGLDGTIRPARGVIGKILTGNRLGIKRFFIPEQNFSQARLVPNVTLVPLNNLRQLYDCLNDPRETLDRTNWRRS